MADEQSTSKKGIPKTEFIEDVAQFLKDDASMTAVESAIKKLEEAHQKYKFIEANMLHQRARLRSKLPELKNSLQLLEVLEEKKNKSESMDTNYVLSEQCYASATVPPTDKVCLWLGANVMLEYSLEEARALLEKNINNANSGITELSGELDFVKDQLTTTEVNMARIYNWGVQNKKTAPSTS